MSTSASSACKDKIVRSSAIDLMLEQATRLGHSSVLLHVHCYPCNAEAPTAEGETVLKEVMCCLVAQYQHFVRFAVGYKVCPKSVGNSLEASSVISVVKPAWPCHA